MFATSGDILNISLAVGFIVLVIFLSILIFYAILVLRDLSKVVSEVEEVVSRVHNTIIEPIKFVDLIFSKLRPYVELMAEKMMKKASTSSKK